MKNKSIDEIYDNMQENIVNDICKDDDLTNLWNELNELDELLKNTLNQEDYKLFDDYLSKESRLIDLERKKAFGYGYNLSNKLMIDSLRE